MILGLQWRQWELIGLLLCAIVMVAAAAWDAGKPRRMPRRPLPYPTRRDYYPKHGEWTMRGETRDLASYCRVVPPSDIGARPAHLSHYDYPSPDVN